MSKKHTTFFALHDDLVRAIAMASETEDFKFSDGMDDERLPVVYGSISDIPRLSEAKYGDQNHEARYLLIPSNATPVHEPFVMNDGRVKNFLYPVHQPS